MIDKNDPLVDLFGSREKHDAWLKKFHALNEARHGPMKWLVLPASPMPLARRVSGGVKVGEASMPRHPVSESHGGVGEWFAASPTPGQVPNQPCLETH